MRWRLIAWVSLGVNIVLAAAWVFSARNFSAKYAAATAVPSRPPVVQTKTNFITRRQLFTWRDVESGDYGTYVSNLRDIGCPEQTIRDIIIAEVNAAYAQKRATELVTADQQWWRSEPDPAVVQAAAEKIRALELERRGLLTSLLGTNWETGDVVSLPRPSRPGVALDGPVLGSLSPETKQAIEDVSLKSEDRLEAYLSAQRRAGKEPDPVAVAKLRQQTRDDLARVLSPPQLEEFLLRYSQNANDLRTEFGQLKYFNQTPDEFRAVFRATDTIDQRIQLLADATDPSSVGQRKALEDQRENAIKTALGPRRYAEYQRLHDPVYRDAVAAAEQAGTPDAADAIYAVAVAAQDEQNRIQSDTNLTAEQKSIEMKRLELQQLQANTAVTGGDLPPEPPSPPTTPPPRKVYVLGPGDSPETIGLMYGLPASAIRAANPNINFSRLKPGTPIVIPPSPLSPQPSP
ncbi:MAG TPA: LysM domain-containing protein [Candidatus Acidoferrum sp.]|nr:LysM domain-containing protein [Candidatus Acidoferrum sp.]